ncbi:uncharacterized protein LOC126721794 [Quercus robur]|uniref:uncharacterized protein LOC126721794 n=1 Tax=Quercus robur TaxID=38942 RepID=UPI0021610F91|nr:uncharacterized protein LOC126721794 [Quercus robur]
MDENDNDVAISTFKSGLPTEHGLRKSLIGKPVTSVCQLMDRIDKYKRVEEDQLQGRGKEKIIPPKGNDYRSEQYNSNQPRRDFSRQAGQTNMQMVNAIFREPMQQVLKRVKNEPFFKWLSKMAGDPSKRNQNLGHLGQAVQEHRKDVSLRPPTGTIHVILTAPGRTGSFPSGVLSVARLPAEDGERESKRSKKGNSLILGFLDEDKGGTIQPHDDALVVTLRIGGFDMKRVIVDPGSAVEVMYPDLYKGLNLRPEDLNAYDSPLISFEGKAVIPKGQIRLPIQTGLEVVEVDFIMVDAYSPYTAIVARPWLHTLGVVSSTLHQKVKYPSGGQVEEFRGDQAMARQCMVAAISCWSNAESSAPVKSL